MTSINWSNVTDFNDIPAQANAVSGGSFWVSMLFMLWIILMLIFSYFGFKIAVLTASFLALTIGVLLAYADLMSIGYVLFFFGVTLVMFLWIIFGSKKNIT